MPEVGKVVRLEATVKLPAGYTLLKCAWTGNITAGEGDPSTNCRYEYTPATGPGPDTTTYGEKTVTLTITCKHTATGAQVQAEKAATYKVFFKKAGDDDGNGIPNWFDYWGDDGAVSSLVGTVYDATLSGYGQCNPATRQVRVGSAAAGTHYASVIVLHSTASCPGGTYGGAEGINCAAEVVAHEKEHASIYHTWDTKTGAVCGALSGPWGGCADGDTPTCHGTPGDDLPDAYETSLGTDPNNCDSCDLATHKAAVYSSYGDNELVAMRAAAGATGDATKDWANPGKQATAATPAARAFETPSATRSGPAGPAAPVGLPLAPEGIAIGRLTGSYSDAGVDDNADGVFEWLGLTVGVEIFLATSYHVVAWLSTETNEDIVWASAGANLTVGVHTLAPLFDGRLISAAASDGPYLVKRVELRTSEDDRVVDAADDAHVTAAYARDDFSAPVAAINAVVADGGIDTDADGLYNSLQVQVSVHAALAGTYTLKAELAGMTSVATAGREVSLSVGVNFITLDFPGEAIFRSREDGPYEVRRVRICDATGDTLDFVHDSYMTESYVYLQFQHGSAVVDLAAIEDQGLDLNGDSRFEYLRVSVPIDLASGGSYRLSADLCDALGTVIGSRTVDVTPPAGVSVISLDFVGSSIYEHGIDGLYSVSHILLLDGQGAIADYVGSHHTTQSYDHTTFSLPLLTLLSGYSDAGVDTDGDGLYNTLLIRVRLSAGDSGVVVAQGCLFANSGKEIQKATATLEVQAEIEQVVTLEFSGETIHSRGLDGPFSLRNLYVYHTGDPEQGVFVSLACSTSPYKYSDFDSPATAAIFRVSATGDVYTDGAAYGTAFISGSADIAEFVPVSELVEAGDVLELDTALPGAYRLSQTLCSAMVAGVVSSQPGAVLGWTVSLEGMAPLALSGIVPVKVTNEGGPIQPGDLLVGSSTPGYAMRWASGDPCPCALVGKALEPMTDDSGMILVLLTAH
jgi:hypothetical protein